jgi:nitrous oxide reductase accessory protein NosL
MNDKYKYIYFDYTGRGGMPEIVAGPFANQQEADDYMKENNIQEGKFYFVDELFDEE